MKRAIADPFNVDGEEQDLAFKRWLSWSRLWRQVLAVEAGELVLPEEELAEVGLVFGMRGDIFAEWLGLDSPRPLLELLEKHVVPAPSGASV